MSAGIRVGGRDIALTHPDKVLFPDDGITKADLARYYLMAAPFLLPHARGRPVSMQRFPDGIGREGFYLKRIPGHFPEWIARAPIPVKERGETQLQVVVENAATLVYLANQDCVTLHVWPSRADRPDVPDRLVLDLDPPGEGGFAAVKEAARRMRDLLEEVGLVPFVMTTGSRGLHVAAPILRDQHFDFARAFAHDLCRLAARQAPDLVTVEPRKDRRGGRIYLDYLRNSYAQTSACPYAVRPLPGAPVATPLSWDELSRPDLSPRSHTLKNLGPRLEATGDPWKGMAARARSLLKARKALDRLLEREGLA